MVLSAVIRGGNQGKEVPYSGDAEGLTINYKIYVCEIAQQLTTKLPNIH